MKQILIFIFFLFATLLYQESFAFDLDIIANNKESSSRILSKKDIRRIEHWIEESNISESIAFRAKMTLKNALAEFKKNESLCDLGFSSLLKQEAINQRAIEDEDQFNTFVGYLRWSNFIDDILYKNLISSDGLDHQFELSQYQRRPIIPPFNRYNDETNSIDLKKFFLPFQSWPDEKSHCSLDAYKKQVSTLNWKTTKDRDHLLRRIHFLGFEKGLITSEVYHKLEAIRSSSTFDSGINLEGYFDVIMNAKDKLTQNGRPVKDPSIYSTTYVVRKEKLTRRTKLYKDFDSTQIMMLAEIIQKTAKRIDAYYVSINFQFEDRADSEIETYVLSPMERYRLSLKMLRKEMAEVMRSDLFKNTTIGYEDLVTAAYETGLIKSEELDLILKFEDFWNPKEPKWKVYLSFTFSIVGTASYYLPPPWNIVGALGLAVTQMAIDSKQKTPDSDDNWNVVI